MSAPATLAHTELSKLKVSELKALCRQHGLAISGNKAALISRLSDVVSASVRVSPAASSTPSSTTSGHADQAQTHPNPPSASTCLAVTDATVAISAPIASPALNDDTTDGSHMQSSVSVPVLTLPAKRPRPERVLVQSAPVKAAKSATRSPLLLDACTSPTVSRSNVFRPLRPSKPTSASAFAPAASASAAAASTSPAAGHVIHTLQDLTHFYAWLLPPLGQEDFGAFLPSQIEGDSFGAVAAYLLTRVYCLLGQSDPDLESEPIANIKSIESVGTGIYRCCFEDDTRHTFIGKTGEILSPSDQLRSDWSDLLSSSQSVQGSSNLMSLIRNQDEDCFDRGISKAFRQTLAQMGNSQEASELLAIAESYVLAHVAVSERTCTTGPAQLSETVTKPNAISGDWQSLHRQCAEFGGLPQSGESWSRGHQRTSLFLPRLHLVESVAINGLHAALAVVQNLHKAQCVIIITDRAPRLANRKFRQSFVFRLTGQIVGEGDEGVLPLFQELIKCDTKGCSLTVRAK